jgi:uroporphyrinogen-III synthase
LSEATFAGLRVISLESRRAEEMDTLIRRYAGDAFVAPSVAERPLESNTELLDYTARLLAGDFDMVVLMTATGLEYWADAAAIRYPRADFQHALARAALVSRGPKPVAVLHKMGLKPAIVVPEPNTWQEMVPLIASRPERRIAVQEYGRPNPEFLAALQQIGAQATALCVYRWDLPTDVGPLRQAAHRIARRECDTVIFTTSVQLTHLLEVARAEGIEAPVRESLARHLAVASVGPIMNIALAAEGLTPDIIPAHPKMASLVRTAAQESAKVLASKRGSFHA